MPNDVRVIIQPYGQGTMRDYTDVACQTLKYGGTSSGGDYSLEFSMKTNTRGLYLPDPYSFVHLVDAVSGALVRKFRTCPLQIPKWNCQYSSTAPVHCEGLAASMQDHTFGDMNPSTHSGDVFFGPTPIKNLIIDPRDPLVTHLVESTVSAFVQKPDVPILALTPEGSIAYAVGFLCSDIVVGDVATTDLLLTQPSQSFMLSNAQQVVDAMSALMSSPFYWHVRAGVFDWGPIDTTPRYQVSLEDGAELSISFDPRQRRNRVKVGYGNNQVATAPTSDEDIDYSKVPIIRDLPVHLGAELSDPGTAFQLAAQFLDQQDTLNLGWSYTITIPKGCPIIDTLTGQRIKPHMVQEGHGIRLVALGGERLNINPAYQPPTEHYISEVSMDPTGVLTLTCGERASQIQARAARQLQKTDDNKNLLKDLYAVTRGKYDPTLLNFPAPLGVGGGLQNGVMPTVPKPGPGTIAPVNTLPPQMGAPHPPPGSFYPTIPLSVGETQPPLGVPPLKITGWEIYCNVALTCEFAFTLQIEGSEIFRAATSGGGTVTPSGVMYAQLFTDPPEVTAGTVPPVVNGAAGANLVIRWDHNDAVGYTCTVEDTNPAINWVAIVLRFERLFPQYSNVVRDPITGAPVFQTTDVGTPLGEDLA